MYKLILWAYRLGQQTERKRVAGLLETYPRWMPPVEKMSHELFGKIDDPKDYSKRNDINKGIDRGIREIVDGISRPSNYEQERYSLLFPKGDK